MANKKTSIKPIKSPKKSTPNKFKAAGMTFTAHSPADWIKDNSETMLAGLAQALRDGDKEAVQDILGGLVRTHSIKD
jgi:hypothetical protein